MPTYERRDFAPLAIRYFLRQTYPNKELIIIDDGADLIKDLVPDSPNISYHVLNQKNTLGAKLNLGCSMAKGQIILHWDDDDWYRPDRLEYQTDCLLGSNKQVCGLNHLLYYDPEKQTAFQYIYPADQKVWLLGSSLCYYKSLWSHRPFADINVGMDALFVWSVPESQVYVLPDNQFSIHLIHSNNISPKKTDGIWWHPYDVNLLKTIMADDWQNYKRLPETIDEELGKTGLKIDTAEMNHKKLRNVYACLVHEEEECIIDLIRNLRYYDPDSPIILYNGSKNPHLFQHKHFYEQNKVSIHPGSHPMQHGYLHEYALSCMEFALECLGCDCLTIVDSDQLATKHGYVEFLSTYVANNKNLGLLSNRPERLGINNTDVWTSIKAFEEYELWKPLLNSFPDGEEKFLHWSFWPSTVIFADAMRDLLHLFKSNKLLQNIMTQTQIWATEEVIIPTLVRLLGYNILKNPCDDRFVQYRVTYNKDDAATALVQPDLFWIHPVNRVYSDETRSFIRQKNNHYIAPRKFNELNSSKQSLSPMLITSLLNRIQPIEGWLDELEADLLVGTTLKSCINLPPPHNLVEIGSFHGKSTVVLGNVVKAFFPEAMVFAIDPHEGHVGASDQGLSTLPPTLQKMKQHIAEEELTEIITIIQDYSYKVVWDKPVCFLFIDGLHDYYNVSRDFWHFSPWLQKGAYIAFHDYADYYPGVVAFVDELLASRDFIKVCLAKSMMVIRKM